MHHPLDKSSYSHAPTPVGVPLYCDSSYPSTQQNAAGIKFNTHEQSAEKTSYPGDQAYATNIPMQGSAAVHRNLDLG